MSLAGSANDAQFGVSSGLGLFPMTFDWAQIAYIGSPLLTPWWAAANVVGGLVIVMWIIAPILCAWLCSLYGKPYTNTLQIIAMSSTLLLCPSSHLLSLTTLESLMMSVRFSHRTTASIASPTIDIAKSIYQSHICSPTASSSLVSRPWSHIPFVGTAETSGSSLRSHSRMVLTKVNASTNP